MKHWMKFLWMVLLMPSLVLAQGTTNSRTHDGVGNRIDSSTSQPAGTERGLITRPASNVPDVTASGSITAVDQTVSLATAGRGAISVQATGTFAGDLCIQLSYDGAASWVLAPYMIRVDSSGTGTIDFGFFTAASAAHAYIWVFQAAGASNVRVTTSSTSCAGVWSSGTAAIAIRASNQPPQPMGAYSTTLVDLTKVVGSITQVATHGTNTTGAGVQSNNVMGEFDDTSPTAITENRFGNLRISANRNLYGTIRDAAGNERGANVNASNELNVSAAVTSVPSNQSVNVNQVSGSAVSTAASGVQKVGIVGNTGTALETTAGVVDVNIKNVANATVATGNGAASGSQRVTIANDSTGIIQEVPGTTGGLSISRTVAGASTNATNVKNAAGQVYAMSITNEATSLRWVHLYNNSGTPTCNTSIIASFGVPGSTTGAGSNVNINVGLAFGTGIAFCITTTRDGTGSVTANDITLNIFYK